MHVRPKSLRPPGREKDNRKSLARSRPEFWGARVSCHAAITRTGYSLNRTHSLCRDLKISPPMTAGFLEDDLVR